MFAHILVALDGSAYAWKAFDKAIGLARAFNSRLSVVSVEENLPKFVADAGELIEEKEYQNGVFERLQRQAEIRAMQEGIKLESRRVLMGHVARSIIDHAKSIQSDLIVMGHSGISGVWANLLGSTAERVSRNAHCTVMIVR